MTQKQRSPITTHILDQTSGKPASGVAVVLEGLQGEHWNEIAKGTTNQDGRIEDLLDLGSKVPSGHYRLIFETGKYFFTLGQKTFFPKVTISFEVANNNEHFHVPLLLSPFAYSTYRGS